MKFQTMSLVAGTKACNAQCPFCVSRMTETNKDCEVSVELNLRNLRKAIQIAETCGITNVLITGKGEPTLYPAQVQTYLDNLDNQFPFVELQTNGAFLGESIWRGYRVGHMLVDWYNAGMTTIMISNVGPDPELNHSVYWPRRKKRLDMKNAIKRAHDAGLIVRYTTVGIKGGVDSPEAFERLVDFCLENDIEQLTWRPVTRGWSTGTSADKWIDENRVSDAAHAEIQEHVRTKGTKLYSLPHGAAVYDFRGQNVCVSNCLTLEPDTDVIRQLIFFPDGKLFADWQFKGSRLL